MNRIAIVATHHKTGTVWMAHTFRMIGEALGITVANAARLHMLAPAERVPPLIFCAAPNDLTRFPEMFEGEEVRILHVIRDPRDVLISGMHYHLRAEEKWLKRPDPELGGKTYSEALGALATDRERYAFEMRHATARTVTQMLAWNYARAESFECRYEELIRDSEGKLFGRAALHMGFARDELAVCRKTFRRYAIFGGEAQSERKGRIAHVRSGEPEQWKGVFNRALGEAFQTAFGDALIRLGYEKDEAWLSALPGHNPGLDAPSLPAAPLPA